MKLLLSIAILLILILFVPLHCIIWMLAGAGVVKILG
jgi:hypothetical protein